MIKIYNLSRDAYLEILKEMPKSIREIEQEYDTVTIEMRPATNITTNSKLHYVTLKYGDKSMSINCVHYNYITII